MLLRLLTSRSEKATGSQLVPGTPGEVLSTVGEVLTTALPHSCPGEASSRSLYFRHLEVQDRQKHCSMIQVAKPS